MTPRPPTLDTSVRHHQLGGEWYELTFAPLPRDGSHVWDAALRAYAAA